MEKASKALEEWGNRVVESGLKGLEKFLITLNNWKVSILNYFNGKVTNTSFSSNRTYVLF
jgi:transposase